MSSVHSSTHNSLRLKPLVSTLYQSVPQSGGSNLFLWLVRNGTLPLRTTLLRYCVSSLFWPSVRETRAYVHCHHSRLKKTTVISELTTLPSVPLCPIRHREEVESNVNPYHHSRLCLQMYHIDEPHRRCNHGYCGISDWSPRGKICIHKSVKTRVGCIHSCTYGSVTDLH